MVPTVATSSPMRTSVSSRSSRMSGSSSTTRTRAAVLFMGLVSSGARLAAPDAEMGARHVVHILECGAVRSAKLAREVKAEPRPLGFGGEERLEELALARARHPGPIVDHGELDAPCIATHGYAYGAVFGTGVAHCVAQEVPHHLSQVLAIELDPGVRASLEREAVGARRLVGDELGEELLQP